MKNLFLFAVLATVLASCGGATAPDEVLKDFVTKLKEGKCDEAEKLATGDAAKNVKTLAKADCMSYKDKEVKDVKCEEEKDDKVECSCADEKYTLEKVDGEWKVAKMPTKDMGGAGDLGSSLNESMGDAMETATETLSEELKNVDMDEVLEDAKEIVDNATNNDAE